MLSKFQFLSVVLVLRTNYDLQVYTSFKDLNEAAGEMDWRRVLGDNTPVTPLQMFRGAREVRDVFEGKSAD